MTMTHLSSGFQEDHGDVCFFSDKLLPHCQLPTKRRSPGLSGDAPSPTHLLACATFALLTRAQARQKPHAWLHKSASRWTQQSGEAGRKIRQEQGMIRDRSKASLLSIVEAVYAGVTGYRTQSSSSNNLSSFPSPASQTFSASSRCDEYLSNQAKRLILRRLVHEVSQTKTENVMKCTPTLIALDIQHRPKASFLN